MVRKTYKELEEEYNRIKEKINKLEDSWDTEEDEVKLGKINAELERLETRKDKTSLAMDKVVEKENVSEEMETEDVEEVCPECGSDLYDVGDGLLFCEKCQEYYEDSPEDSPEEDEE